MESIGTSRVIRLGLVAGLAATVVMDLAMLGTLRLLGKPPAVFFSFIGEVVAAFGALLRIEVSGSIALGAGLHYMIGFVLGVIFVVVAQKGLLPVGRAALTLVVAIAYVQGASLLLLIPAARLLDLAAPDLHNLFGVAVVFHTVWGTVLGAVYFIGTSSHERPSTD